MSRIANDRLMQMMQDLEALRAELAQVRNQQRARTARQRGCLALGWLTVLLVLGGSWAWSAPTSTDLEKRLAVLESLIRKGPSGTTQVTGPLDVLGASGSKAVIIEADPRSGNAGAVTLLNPAGSLIAKLSAAQNGDTGAFVLASKGAPIATIGLTGEGKNAGGVLSLSNPAGNISIGQDDSAATVAIWPEPGEGGRISMRNDQGKHLAGMGVLLGSGTVYVASGQDEGSVYLDGARGGQSAQLRVEVGKKNVAALAADRQNKGAGLLTIISEAGEVAVGSKKPSATVAIWPEPGEGGRISMRNDQGKHLAGMGVLLGSGTVYVASGQDEGSVYLDGARGGQSAQLRVEVGKKNVAALAADRQNKGAGLLTIISEAGEVAVGSKKPSATVAIWPEPGEGGRVSVRNKDGKPLAGIGAIQGRGHVFARDADDTGQVQLWGPDGSARASLEVLEAHKVVAKVEADRQNKGAGLLMIRNVEEKDLVRLHADHVNGGGRVTVMNSEGKPVVQVSSEKGSGGLVAVANSKSLPVAQMSVVDDVRGLVQINKNQKGIASLTESRASFGGMLQLVKETGVAGLSTTLEAGTLRLGDEGHTTVEAATLTDGRGIVRAFPNSGCAGVGTVLFKATKNNCITGEK